MNLEILDLSYNRIRKLEGLSALRSLRRIYLVHNKIEAITGLDSLVKLELLELGDNRIKASIYLFLFGFSRFLETMKKGFFPLSGIVLPTTGCLKTLLLLPY